MAQNRRSGSMDLSLAQEVARHDYVWESSQYQGFGRICLLHSSRGEGRKSVLRDADTVGGAEYSGRDLLEAGDAMGSNRDRYAQAD
jgi:hypothetical protein